MRHLSSTAIAYIAAMIDAEGVVSITRVKSPGKRRPFQYRQLAQVANSHAGLIGFLRELTGVGIIHQNKHNPKKPHWAPIHRWTVMMAEFRQLLPVVFPYLVIKREVASVVLEFKPAPKKSTLAEQDRIYSEQESVYQRVKFMNARGFGSFKTTKKLADFPDDHPLLVRDSHS